MTTHDEIIESQMIHMCINCGFFEEAKICNLGIQCPPTQLCNPTHKSACRILEGTKAAPAYIFGMQGRHILLGGHSREKFPGKIVISERPKGPMKQAFIT